MPAITCCATHTGVLWHVSEAHLLYHFLEFTAEVCCGVPLQDVNADACLARHEGCQACQAAGKIPNQCAPSFTGRDASKQCETSISHDKTEPDVPASTAPCMTDEQRMASRLQQDAVHAAHMVHGIPVLRPECQARPHHLQATKHCKFDACIASIHA